MLTSGNFWAGALVGVVSVWAYHKYMMKKTM